MMRRNATLARAGLAALVLFGSAATCRIEAVPFWKNGTVLAGLGAAVAGIGTAAVVATRDDASGSR